MSKDEQTPSTHVIPAPALEGIRARQALIAQHQLIVSALDRELMAFVAGELGVDLVNEHWALDMAHGLLVRQDKQSGMEESKEAVNG